MDNSKYYAATLGFVTLMLIVFAMTPSDQQLALDNAQLSRELKAVAPIDHLPAEACFDSALRARSCNDLLIESAITGYSQS